MNPTSPSDEQDPLTQALVEAQANPASYSKVVELGQEFVYSICFTILRSVQDAEDACQSTFWKVFLALQTFSAEWASAGTFFRTVAYRESVEIIRVRKKRQFCSLILDPVGREDPVASLEADELQANLERTLDALPEELGSCVKLKYLEGYTYQAIATKQGSSLSLVYRRVQEGVALLRETLAEDD